VDSNETAAFAHVQGIWKVYMAGTDVIMALNQSGEYLYGLAKRDGGHPWNGAAAGRIFGKEISISLAAMKGEILAATYMSGTVEGDLMKGSHVRSDSSGVAARAESDANRISTKSSDHAPLAARGSQDRSCSNRQYDRQGRGGRSIRATGGRKHNRAGHISDEGRGRVDRQIQGCHPAGQRDQPQHTAQNGGAVVDLWYEGQSSGLCDDPLHIIEACLWHYADPLPLREALQRIIPVIYFTGDWDLLVSTTSKILSMVSTLCFRSAISASVISSDLSILSRNTTSRSLKVSLFSLISL
jgi:hypothetical protein